MHSDDVAVSEGIARTLIDSQFPDYAGLALSLLPSAGSVNVVFRLGSRLTVRFPRRASDANANRAALEREAVCAGMLRQVRAIRRFPVRPAEAQPCESFQTLS